ncbi:hypothetical protein HA46_04795 [Pantoea septica]|uniref:Uncharacterized protein n=1 Tax=Pantoea septica TaxID=472695 RepID=A0ABX3UWW0_9GAMM|nr:hypothetical protein HA46_04795 [Pantoea septica]
MPADLCGQFFARFDDKAVRRRLLPSGIQIFILILILNVIFYILIIFWHLIPLSAGDIFYAAWDLAVAGNGIDIIGTF